MRSTYVIATIKPWNIENFRKYGRSRSFVLITRKRDLSLKRMKKLNPRYIFFPHWSWIIPEDIWRNFECVVFHMTDLPYGRGGTPLQNLILRGHKTTKISALRVGAGIDTGDIYLKVSLSLRGSAEEIYRRASKLIFQKLIPYIVKHEPVPRKQRGKAVKFQRRIPHESEISANLTLPKLYDFIRMLDAEDYPRAFLRYGKLKFEFSQGRLLRKKLISKVEICHDQK